MKPELFDAVDLDAYFDRIGYSDDRTPTLDTLTAIHQCHTQTIAFENFNSLTGNSVLLDLPSLQQKLIHAGRGGYCFEQNLLFRTVLAELGFEVTNLAARVLWNVPAGTVTPRSHMVLRVRVDGQDYLADVGFGGLTLTTPLALVTDVEQDTSHEPFRLVMDGSYYLLQALLGQEWKPLYRFDLQEQHLPDYEVSNWYVSTHPQSLFTNHLIAAKPDADCRYALLNSRFTTHYLDGRIKQWTLENVEEFRAVLTEKFGLNLDAIANLDETLHRLLKSSID